MTVSMDQLESFVAAAEQGSFSGAAKQLLAGWQVNGVAYWQSGLPFNVTNSTARANTSAGT